MLKSRLQSHAYVRPRTARRGSELAPSLLLNWILRAHALDVIRIASVPVGRPETTQEGRAVESHAEVRLSAICVGQVRPLYVNGPCSGIDKQPITGVVKVGKMGIEGDEQFDRVHHGGPDKAIHHYPFKHYAAWAAQYPELKRFLSRVPAFGENFVTSGLTESDICIGDDFRVGSAIIQVSLGRRPCWKLNVRSEHSQMVELVRATRRTGWYYRVVQPGSIRAGDALLLTERRHPNWPVSRALDAMFAPPDPEECAALAALPELGDSWRRAAGEKARAGVADAAQPLPSMS